MLGKSEVDVKPGQGRIAAQSGQVFRDAHTHAPRLHFGKHGLKAGTVIVGAGVTVIHEKYRVREAVVFSVLEQDSLLESGLSRGDYPNYIFFECVNYPLSICSDGRQ